MRSQLKKNALAGSLYSAGTTLAMGASYPLYLHYLGYSRYGLWLVLSTVLSFVQLGNLGLGQALSKQVATEHGLKDYDQVITCVSTALSTLLCSGLILCFALTVLRSQIARCFHLPTADTALLLFLLPAVGPISVYAIFLDTYSSALAGLGRLDLYSYFQLASQVVAVLATIVLLHAGLGIVSFMVGNTLGFLVAHALIRSAIHSVFGRPLFCWRRFSFAQLKRMLSLSVYLMGSSVLAILLTPLNRLLLARYVGLFSLPVYDILYNGCMKVRSLAETAVRALMPEVSRVSASPNSHARMYIADLNRRATWMIVVGGGLLYIVLLIWGGNLLTMWLGERASHVPRLGLRISLIGTFTSLLGVPSFYILLGLGKGRPLLTANVLQSAIPVICVIGLLWFHCSISVVLLLTSVALGMFGSSVYLIWKRASAVSSLTAAA